MEKDRQLEVTERQRVVTLADIEKDKAVEIERRAIQEVIRERVIVQRAVVEEEEKIKDTHEIATVERAKTVAVTTAEQEAQEKLVKEIKAAEAARDSAMFAAEEKVILAEADRDAAEKETAAKKMLAEGVIAEEAALGTAEANVTEKKALAQAVGIEARAVAEAKGTEAKAVALEQEGTAQAAVLEAKAVAEARGLEAMAVALEKEGTAEATVIQLKFAADANGITEKAKAMKIFNEAGKEHEEFKLQLTKNKEVEIAAIQAQAEIATQQAGIIGNALKSAHIDIVGGETEFFDKITTAITSGKVVDRWVGNSQVLTDVKDTFFNGDPQYFQNQIQKFVGQFKLSAEDVKNLSVSALIAKMTGLTDDEAVRRELEGLLGMVRAAGMSDKPTGSLRMK